MSIDEKLKEILNYNNGFYIECGANDGITQSYTHNLELEKNWSGLLIEPSSKVFNRLKTNRSSKNIFYNQALVSKDYVGDTVLGDFDGDSAVNGLMAKIGNGVVEVKCSPLSHIINKENIKYVDFFSLDVEGYELEVLKGINFDVVYFKYILIELHPSPSEVHQENWQCELDILNFFKNLDFKEILNNPKKSYFLFKNIKLN